VLELNTKVQSANLDGQAKRIITLDSGQCYMKKRLDEEEWAFAQLKDALGGVMQDKNLNNLELRGMPKEADGNLLGHQQ
jgi:hypothetical protein